MGALRAFLATPAGRFVARYLVFLFVLFGILALKPVNDSVVNPYTTFVAHEARLALNLLGEHAKVTGQILSSPRYSVAIFNGCNGLEAILIFVSGVVAFPATWRRKVLGVLVGLLAIQAFNVIRIVALFYTGVYFPRLFSTAHIFVWQSLVIVFAVVLWLLWVRPDAIRRPTAS